MTEQTSPMIFEAVEAFKAMTDDIKILLDMVKMDGSIVMLPEHNPDIFGQPPSELRDTLLSLWYESDGDGRNTLVFQGLVVASKEVLCQVLKVNQSKEQFHKVMQEINKDKAHSLQQTRHAITGTTSVDRELLKFSGLSRLNLKHCYRPIPYSTKPIIKAGFSWSSGELSITKLTPDEAITQLQHLNKDLPTHIRIQIDKASALPPNTRLAKVQINNHRLKANLVMEETNEFGEQEFVRKTIRTSLPLFVLRGNKVPDVVFRERPKEKTERLKRHDKKIEEEAFLPSIRAHLYR